MKLSFVIPVYNEEESLQTLYDEIRENLNGNDYEMIFIDDGSIDHSFQVLKGLATRDSRVRVIRFRKNFGKAAGLQTGFEIASGDYIITLDGDLQDNPMEIPRFLKKLAEGYDLVIGWKRKRKDPLSKTLPSKLFNWVTSRVFGQKLHDYNCGFKAYGKDLVKELDIYGEMHRYIPAIAKSRGFRVTEIPVEHRTRKYGKSKYGKERYFRGFLDLLTVKLVTSYIHSPLYLFGRIGAFFSLTGFLLGVYLSVMKFVYHQPLANRPLLFLAVLLIMIGLQFFSIGLLGELIINQNRNTNHKTDLSILDKLNIS